METLDKDNKIGCIVLTGSTRAFAGKKIFLFLKNNSIFVSLFGLLNARAFENINHTKCTRAIAWEENTRTQNH